MMKRRALRVLFALSALAAPSIFSVATAEQPQSANLGFTGPLDGTAPFGPGLYYQNYLQYYTSSRINDAQGNKLPLPRQSVDLSVDANQIIYLSPTKVGPGAFGVDAVVPVFTSTRTRDGLGGAALKAEGGLGDIVFGPFYEMDPIIKDGHPVFQQRFEFDVIAPTGRYNRDYTISPGSNFWTINPYWAATFWVTPKLTASWRFNYLYNLKNHEPSAQYGPDARWSKPGQSIAVDLASEYALTESFRIGVDGYIFTQLDDTKVDGVSIADSKEREFGAGPELVKNIGKSDIVLFNTYFEFGARNRPQGTRLQLRYAHHF